ncbi:uncharacterized protein [Oncorhynchus clarkii lewisi]|uniref:uncharacterized protein n=1 Tax=Oncorhynchus clarkii lewisi TaxID=490388 RepID=UPI0039B9586E
MNLSEENRTVVVSGVPDTLSSSRMADKLVIHFQRSRSHGGDVENIKYPTSFKGVAFVTFENTRDAEMVIRKKQIMCDKEFPQDYPITVFKFTQDVLFYVNAKVDLSIFGDEEQQETVIQSLQSAHRSVRICLLPSQEGKASVEGPFSAIRDLREDLLQGATASSSSHPGEKHGAPWSSGYSLTSVAAGNGVSQVSSSHPGEKHGAPSSSSYSLTSVAAGNGVSQVSSGHPGEKHGAPSSSGYSLTSVAAGNGVSQVSSGHPGEKHRAPSSSGYSLTSVAAGNGVSQVSSSHAWEKHRAPSPSSHDHSLSSVVAESRSSRVRSGDGAEVDFRVSRYTWEKKNRAAASSADHSLSSSVAGGSGASTINQSLEKHRSAAPSSADHSLSSSVARGSGASTINQSLEKHHSAAPSSDHSLSSSVAGGSGASTINQALEKHRSAAPSSDHSLSSSVAGGSGASTINQSLEKHRSAAPSSDHSLSSSVAGGSGASTINQSLEKHRSAAPSSDHSLSSSVAGGSGESKVVSISHTLEKYIAPSSSDQSLSSMASGSGESKVISSSHTLEKYITPSSSDQSLSSPVATGTSKVISGGDVDMEEESTWVDTNLFLYIQRFSKDQFDQCFRNHGVSAVFGDSDVADLTLISLRGRRDSKGLSEVQLTISELTDLVAVWQSTLRIHTIDYRRQDLRERKRLLQICAEANTLYEDVLYVQKELSVRVIGPSISSHLFTEWVKDRRDQPDKEVFL